MIKNITVRFFTLVYEEDLSLVEISEDCFKELAEKQNSSISYERHTKFDNGVDQICLTVESPDYPALDELQLI